MLNLLEGKYDVDLPFVSEARASMQNQKDLMIIAAMFHDVAKPYRHGDIHGWESADILRDLLGVDYDNRVAEWAVRHHMPMPFSHKAEFNLSNPEAIEVAKNIARDARRIGIDANTAINAFVLINAADVINGRELNVDDNWAKKAGEEGLKKYNGDISVKNVLSVELKEKVALLKKAFDEIKDENFGDTTYNYSHQERFDYNAFPEGGREDKKLPYLNNTEYTGVSKVVDENGEPLVVWHTNSSTEDESRIEEFDRKKRKTRGKWLYYFSTSKDSSQSYLRRSDSDSVIFDKNKTIRDILSYLHEYYSSSVDKIIKKFNIDINFYNIDEDSNHFPILPNEDYLYGDIISYIQEELVRITGKPEERRTNYNGVLVNYEHYQNQTREDQRLASDYIHILNDLIVGRDFRNSKFSTKKEWNTYPVYISIKAPFGLDAEGKNWDDFEYSIRKQKGKYLEDYYLEERKNTNSDGLEVENYIDTYDQSDDRRIISTTYAVDRSVQIKHVENLGTWNPSDPNIYHLKRDIASDEDTEYFTPTNAVDAFGQELAQSLLNGDTVSSSQLMRSMLSRGIFHSIDKPLASALSAHDIPVRVGYDMHNGELAKIVTEGKGSVIFINPNELSQISRGYAGTVLMHEIVHALTVDIINNPKTQAEKDFVELNRRTWQSLCNKFKHLDVYSRDVVDGMYALTDEKEFAACFASDPHVRQQIYELAEKFDRVHGGNKFISRLKKLVSRLVKALTGKAVFNKETLSKDVHEYEESLTKFLLNQPQIVEGNISERSVLRKVYANSNKSVLSHENFIESMKTLEKMQQLEKIICFLD